MLRRVAIAGLALALASSVLSMPISSARFGSGMALAQNAAAPDGGATIMLAEPETLRLRGALEEPPATQARPPGSGGEAVRLPVRAAPAEAGIRADVRAPVREPLQLRTGPEAAPAPEPVAEEADPFAPTGIGLGAFRAFATFRQDLGYDTNPERNRIGGRGDWFSRSRGGLRLESDWARHELRATIDGAYDAFRRDSANNRPRLDADAALRLDLHEGTRLVTTGRLGLDTERPGSLEVPGSIVNRPRILTSAGQIALEHDRDRIRLALRGGLSHTDHADGRDSQGAAVDQSARDITQYEGAARIGVEISPGLIPFAEIGIDRRLPGATADRRRRDRVSTGLTGRVGASFELTRLLTGEASLGYQHRRYVDPSRPAIGGLVADAGLTWMPGRFTTLTLRAASSLDETAVAGASTARAMRLDLGFAHELRRRLVLRGELGHRITRYGGAGPTERSFTGGVGLDYRFNRYAAAALDYRWENLRSTRPDAGYDASIYLLGLRLNY
jgi:hypothetical protein